MESRILVNAIKKLLIAMHKAGEEAMGKEIEGIVLRHSIGASATAVGSAWLPGVGATAATAACAGFVWSMFYRINSKLGIPFGKNVLKSVATAIGTNLAAAAVGSIVASTVLSFIPIVGNLTADLVMAGVCFGLTWSSGLVYLKVLTRLASKGVDFGEIGEDELKATAQEIIADEDVKGMMKEAKGQFKEAKARGDIRKDGGNVEPLES